MRFKRVTRCDSVMLNVMGSVYCLNPRQLHLEKRFRFVLLVARGPI